MDFKKGQEKKKQLANSALQRANTVSSVCPVNSFFSVVIIGSPLACDSSITGLLVMKSDFALFLREFFAVLVRLFFCFDKDYTLIVAQVAVRAAGMASAWA